MPIPVRFAPAALRDLQRLREILRPKSPVAAQRAGQAIAQGVQVLGLQPGIGRPAEGLSHNYREWPIDFGDSGYIALYRLDADAITILAVRHQREAGY